MLLFLTPMFYAVAKQIWHMIDGQNLNYVHGQTIQRFRQWYDWTVSGIFTFNLRMPWDSSNKNVKKSFVLNKIEIILPRDMLFLIVQWALFYGFISYCIIKLTWYITNRNLMNSNYMLNLKHAYSYYYIHISNILYNLFLRFQFSGYTQLTSGSHWHATIPFAWPQ